MSGFKEQYISGDNGGYWRNELNYLLFTLPGIGQVSALAALDGGWLHADRLDPYASGTLWGTAVGLSTAIVGYPPHSLQVFRWRIRTGLARIISISTIALPLLFKGLLSCLSLLFVSHRAC